MDVVRRLLTYRPADRPRAGDLLQTHPWLSALDAALGGSRPTESAASRPSTSDLSTAAPEDLATAAAGLDDEPTSLTGAHPLGPCDPPPSAGAADEAPLCSFFDTTLLTTERAQKMALQVVKQFRPEFPLSSDQLATD